jgi:hypothetical protein
MIISKLKKKVAFDKVNHSMMPNSIIRDATW